MRMQVRMHDPGEDARHDTDLKADFTPGDL